MASPETWEEVFKALKWQDIPTRDGSWRDIPINQLIGEKGEIKISLQEATPDEVKRILFWRLGEAPEALGAAGYGVWHLALGARGLVIGLVGVGAGLYHGVKDGERVRAMEKETERLLLETKEARRLIVSLQGSVSKEEHEALRKELSAAVSAAQTEVKREAERRENIHLDYVESENARIREAAREESLRLALVDSEKIREGLAAELSAAQKKLEVGQTASRLNEEAKS